MPVKLQPIQEGLFLYVWEGRVTLPEIRGSMSSAMLDARRVVFDISEVAHHPVTLIGQGVSGHRRITKLQHVYIVHKQNARSWAKLLITTTLNVAYSFYDSREAALAAAQSACAMTE